MGASHGGWEPTRPIAGSVGLDEASATAVSAVGRHAAGVEPMVTATMLAIAGRYRMMELVGLEHRLKSVESMSRKVANAMDARRAGPVALVEALGSMNDLVRYTAVIPDRFFEQTANLVMGEMEDRGLVHVRTKNTFGRPGYQGCNTTWRASGGVLFELQFHSPQSWNACVATHVDYEKKRVATSDEARAIHDDRIVASFADVVAPPGADRVRGPQRSRVAPLVRGGVSERVSSGKRLTIGRRSRNSGFGRE